MRHIGTSKLKICRTFAAENINSYEKDVDFVCLAAADTGNKCR